MCDTAKMHERSRRAGNLHLLYELRKRHLRGRRTGIHIHGHGHRMIAPADRKPHGVTALQPLLLRQQIAIRPGGVAAELAGLHFHMSVRKNEPHLLRLQCFDGQQLGGDSGTFRLLHRRQDKQRNIPGRVCPDNTQLPHL